MNNMITNQEMLTILYIFHRREISVKLTDDDMLEVLDDDEEPIILQIKDARELHDSLVGLDAGFELAESRLG